HSNIYKSWNGSELIEAPSIPSPEDYKGYGMESLSSIPSDVLNSIIPFEVHTYSDEKQSIQAQITVPGTIYQTDKKSYQGPGVVETEAEEILPTTESLWISA